MEDAPGLPPSLGFSSPPLSARHILEQVVAAHSPLLASDAIPAALGVSDDTYQLDYQATEAEFIADYLEGLHRAPSFSNSELGLQGIASIQLGAGPNPPLPPSPLPSRPNSETSFRSEKEEAGEDSEAESPPEVPPMPARRVRSYSNSVDGDAWHTEESFSPKNAALLRSKTIKSPPQLSLNERSSAGRMNSIDLSTMQRGDSFNFNPDGSPQQQLRAAIDRSSSHGSTGSRNSFEISTPTSPMRYATNSSLRVPSNATDSSAGSYQSSSASSLAVSINATPRTSLTSGRTGIHSPISPTMGSTSIRIATTNRDRNSNPTPTAQSSPPNHTRGDSGSSSARGFIKPHGESSFVEMLLSTDPNNPHHSTSPLSVARANHKSGSLSDLHIPDSNSVPKPPLSCEASPTDLDVAQLQRLGSPKHHLMSETGGSNGGAAPPASASPQFNISTRGTSVFETGFNAIMSSASHSPPTVPSTSIYQSSNSPLQVPQSPSHSSPSMNASNTFRLKLLRKPSMTENIGSPVNSSSGASPTNVSNPKPPTAPFGFNNLSPVNVPQASPMPSPMQPAASLLNLAVSSTSSTSTASATSSAGNSYMLASSSAPNSASGSDPNYSPDSATFLRDNNQPAPPPLSPLMQGMPSPSNASGSLLKGRAGRKINVVFGNKPSSQTQESPAIQPHATPLPGDEFSSL